MLVRSTLVVVAALGLCAGAPPQKSKPVPRPAQAAPFAGDWHAAEAASRSDLRNNPSNEQAAVLHARALIHLGQPFDAALELEDFLNRKPDSTSAGKLYAALLMDVVQDRTKSEEVLLRCARISPADPEVQEALGKLHLLRHRYPEAIECFRKALRLKPANPLYSAELAKSFEKAEQPLQAAAEYRRALAQNRLATKPEPAVYTLYAEYLAEQRRFDEAIRVYTDALLIDPHNAIAYQGRGLAYESLGELRRAESDALAALREAADRKDSRQLLLRVYRSNGDQENLRKQADALEKLVASEQTELSKGREMRASLNQAEALLAAGKLAEAIPAYERVVAAMPSFYEAWFALGVCYGGTGQTSQAEAALRKYLGFQPLSADGHAALGLLLTGLKRHDEARPELEQAIALNPDAAEARKALAFLLLNTREYAEAAKNLDTVIRTGAAPDAETYGLAARALFGSGRKQEALQLCEAGLHSFPANQELESFYATLLSDCSKQTSCRAKAIGALKQNPRSPAYLKAVTSMLVETAPLDPATESMVEQTFQMLQSDAEAGYLRAKWLLANNRLDRATEEAMRISSTPDVAVRARVLTLAGIAADRLGDASKAEARFREAHAANATLPAPDPAIAIPYVDFLIQQSRDGEADQIVAEVLRWNPAFGPGLLRRATYLSNSGKPEEAVRVAESLVKQADGDEQVLRATHVLLAKTYTALGRPEQAKPHLAWVVSR